MGYELFEQLGGRLPDAIIYPTGGGTGLVGMWKAFDEMQRLGWIGSERPRMISVQAVTCAPIVRAWEEGAEHARAVDRREYLRVRVARAARHRRFSVLLRAIRESEGAAVAVTDDEMREGVQTLGRATGIFAAPEGGATVAAVPALLERGVLLVPTTTSSSSIRAAV